VFEVLAVRSLRSTFYVMNVTGWSRGLEVSVGGQGVMPHAGLALLRHLADRTGLTGCLARTPPAGGGCAPCPNPPDQPPRTCDPERRPPRRGRNRRRPSTSGSTATRQPATTAENQHNTISNEPRRHPESSRLRLGEYRHGAGRHGYRAVGGIEGRLPDDWVE